MNNSNNFHPYAAQSYSLTLLVNISRILFGLFALIGNGFILYVIGRNTKIQANLYNLLIGVLAFADFWTGAGLFVCSSVTLGFQIIGWHNYTFKDCLIIHYFGLAGMQMSQIATIFIAFDRLKAVQDPILYSVQDRIQRFSLALSVTVIYSLTATGFIFVGSNLNDHPPICQGGSVLGYYFLRYWYLFALVVAVIIFVCYVSTSRIMTNKLMVVDGDRFNQELAMQRAVFKSVRIVLIIYGLCWCLPNFVIISASLLGADGVLLGKLTPIVAIGIGLNSSLNVIVYAWKHRELGMAMRKALGVSTGTPAVQSIELLSRTAPTAYSC